MSVPAGKRQKSSMQYIDTALQFASDMLTFTNGLPNRIQDKLAKPMFLEVLSLVKNVSCANRIYVRDEETYKHRRAHLIEALGNLDTVAAYLDIYWRHFVRTHPIPNDEQAALEAETMLRKNEKRYLGFAESIEEERKLIHGVLTRDKKANEKQAVGKPL